MTVALSRRYDDPRVAEMIAAAIEVDNPSQVEVRTVAESLEICVIAPSAASARATLEDLMACIQAAERTVGSGRGPPT